MPKPPVIPNELFAYERMKHHWTQGDVADNIGAPDVKTIGRWERGEVAPSPYYQVKLAEVFGKSARGLGFPPDGQISFWHVPYRRNAFFTGREDILQLLRDTLLAQHASPVPRLPLALSGLGGVGKSQIALEYAYRYREHYHTVLWLHAASYQGLVSDVTAVADLLDLPGKNEANPDQLIERLKEWLTQLTRWLLIFDNVEDLQLLDDFLPAEIKGHLILTTLSQNTGTHAHRIAVEPMDNNTGAELLLRRAKLIAIESTLEHMAGTDAAIARSLSEDMGGLPLALDQAGAYIEETAVSLSQYEQRYQEKRRDLLDRRGSWVSEYSEHPIPVAATLKLSFEKACERDPIAANILNFCAFLHPDAIPEELFQHDDSFKVGPTVFDEAIAALLRYSLIKRNTQEETLSLHRLVKAVLSEDMPTDIRKQWRERVARALSAAFPDAREFKNWSLCERLVSHALECATWTKEELTPTVEVAVLFRQAGFYLRARGQYSIAETLMSRVLLICKQHFGDEHLETAMALNNLAVAYLDQDMDEQAEPLLVRAASIIRDKMGARELSSIHVHDNLARLHMRQGKYEKAEYWFQQAIHIWELSETQELETAFQLELASNMSSLAELYGRQGKFEQAEPLLVRARSIYEQQLEAEHPHVTSSQITLANLYALQGKFEQAEPLFQHAIPILEKQFGAEHPHVTKSQLNLANVYFSQYKIEQAEYWFQHAIPIREKQLGAEHPMIALDLFRLASILHSFARFEEVGERYEQAGALYQRSISILEQQDATHPFIQSIHGLYADFLHDRELYAEAAALAANDKPSV